MICRRPGCRCEVPEAHPYCSAACAVAVKDEPEASRHGCPCGHPPCHGAGEAR